MGTETQLADAQLMLGQVHGSWTADGEQFFYGLDVDAIAQGAPVEIGRWALGEQFDQVDAAPHGRGLRGFVTLPPAAATGLLSQIPPDR